jgi:hypothetical protein
VTGSIYKVGAEDDFLPSYFIKSDEVTTKTKCGVFDLTKA